jgi:hypothetical protein
VEETKDEVKEVIRINPKFSLVSYMKRRDGKDQEKNDKTITAYREADLKEFQARENGIHLGCQKIIFLARKPNINRFHVY